VKLQALIILVVLLFVLAFSFAGARAIWQPDEGYYVGAAVLMNLQNQYMVPNFGEEIFLDKPPVVYWASLAGIKLFGQSEFSARFFTGLFYALTAIVVFILGKSFRGRFYEGIWASIIYATMIIPFIAGNFVTPDTPLTFFTTLSMAAFWFSLKSNSRFPNLWKLIFFFALGLGFLTKGPAALIPCGAMFVYLLITKQLISFTLSPSIIFGMIIFAVTGLSWYLYIAWKLPNAADYFFDSMIWGRLVSGKYQRNPGLSGAIIYLPIIFLGTMPWSIMWFTKENGIRKFFSKKSWQLLTKDPSGLLLACWIILPMTVFCLASSKLGLYALPVFPALALCSVRLLPESADISVNKSFISLKPVTKGISFVFIWIVLLLIVRMSLGIIPVSNDCRLLWKELAPHIPNGKYEIVTVDNRSDGLFFYGAMEVENITQRTNPYPTFMPPDTIELELEEMKDELFPHLFLIHSKKHLDSIEKILSSPNWDIQSLPLRFNRWLIICSPKTKTS
jgi:4-amino-4-deoxy-L-arabinose transferase-like glycosyltransferase